MNSENVNVITEYKVNEVWSGNTAAVVRQETHFLTLTSAFIKFRPEISRTGEPSSRGRNVIVNGSSGLQLSTAVPRDLGQDYVFLDICKH